MAVELVGVRMPGSDRRGHRPSFTAGIPPRNLASKRASGRLERFSPFVCNELWRLGRLGTFVKESIQLAGQVEG